ncbi:DUF6173 family protein [Marinovum sp. 2_MG-2023]|uniref:DUF6173 family protein n=1 Tax=unclassified Marinovum TaxID=2647166 RepID=UPI0026E2E37D|nr:MULTISPECIES: DUF6173 family protein [unclassified Marinovum]MDO6731765.1 DUF6173 family protein [Marinovum sp. 2_MG-2023]MDO6781017.1 DUF6173 family protein [Marinovum sp. 1_MG-2023]
MQEHDISTTAEAAEAAALPRRIEVYAEGQAPAKGLPPADCLTNRPVAQKSAAEWAYERLVLYIRDFEAGLDNEHEVAMGFTGGQAGILRIEGMGYFDPDIITFHGTDAQGIRTQLVQHVSQLNVLLRALPTQVETAAPRRIGFRLAEQLEKVAREADTEAT